MLKLHSQIKKKKKCCEVQNVVTSYMKLSGK